MNSEACVKRITIAK